MKALPLSQFTNVDKAALLHQLFPDEIPALLEFIAGMCQSIKEDEQRNRAAWDNGFMPFDYWLGLVNQTEEVVNKKAQSMIKADWYFLNSYFLVIQQYMSTIASACILE